MRRKISMCNSVGPDVHRCFIIDRVLSELTYKPYTKISKNPILLNIVLLKL